MSGGAAGTHRRGMCLTARPFALESKTNKTKTGASVSLLRVPKGQKRYTHETGPCGRQDTEMTLRTYNLCAKD